MAVDFTLPPHWLVVHGVQADDDDDLQQDHLISEEIRKLPEANGLEFTSSIYKYENINDKAQTLIREALSLLQAGLIAKQAIDRIVDIVGDVVINWRQGETAKLIGEGLKLQILDHYRKNTPLFLLAHSLGTVYAFDIVNELMASEDYYTGNIESWPVQGLITLGSPLGLNLFNRHQLQSLRAQQEELFRWINIWDRTDPVVTGNIFGLANTSYEIAGKFAHQNTGWAQPQDYTIDSTSQHLAAHVSYWSRPEVARYMIDLMVS